MTMQKYFPNITPISYEEAVSNAIKEIENDQVISRWNDNFDNVWEKTLKMKSQKLFYR